MARFFFHLTGALPVEDDEGEEFSTPEDAIAAGKESARDIAKNRPVSEVVAWVFERHRRNGHRDRQLYNFRLQERIGIVGRLSWRPLS